MGKQYNKAKLDDSTSIDEIHTSLALRIQQRRKKEAVE